MASAYKCDACGKLYERDIQSRMRIFVEYHPYGDRQIDLCDSCLNKIKEMLRLDLDD